MIEKGAEDDDVIAAANEGERDKIDAGFDADADIVFVFFGERREIDIHAGEIDVAAGAKFSRR